MKEGEPTLTSEVVAADVKLVVGIGASGANVGALRELLKDFGGAENLVMVLAMQHREALDGQPFKAFLNECGLQLTVVEDGMPIESGHVYLPDPDVIVTIDDGRLSARPAEEPAGERGTIDSFFLSLAENLHERAVGVILAGVGGDGTLGTTAIREAGGLTIAEHVEDASGRDRDAHGAVDLADFILKPGDIARQVKDYARHLARLRMGQDLAGRSAELSNELDVIASILLKHTSHDFHGYKKNTFLRRIQRRMQVVGAKSIQDYIEVLRGSSDEPQNLFNDLLIGVTHFFRDRAEFELLEGEVIPKLFENKTRSDQVRLWVLGCATGEEAYSLAILLRERMAKLEVVPGVQIFATDIDGTALAAARVGRFSKTIERDVTQERLARWFVKEGDTYCVVKELREMCIFSQHNLIRDPPFSRVDLVSCRNLLIYLDVDLQDKVIPLFHFGLRPGGYLFLGNSETVTRNAKLFAPIDRRYRIFRRLDAAVRTLPDFPVRSTSRTTARETKLFSRPQLHDSGLARRAERIAERYAPAYVITDESYDVLHFSAGTGRFLDPSSGTASLNLLNLVQRDLRLDLRAALNTAAEKDQVVRVDNLQVGLNGKRQAADLIVEPIRTSPDASKNFMVLFKEGAVAVEHDGANLNPGLMRDEHVQRLDAELRLTRERLQATIEELESTNEELKSSNEEYQSVNEELQSANEEMETSKEELQSVNEELTTVNGELAHRVQELGRANSDLKNLLESTQIATVFLDNDLRVTNYTPAVTEIFHFVDSDLGRPLAHIKSRVDYDEMHSDIRSVLRTLRTTEREIVGPENVRYIARVLPYRSTDNFIAGVVITFVDITPMSRAEQALRESEERFRSIVTQAAVGIAQTNANGQFVYVNDRYGEIIGRPREEIVGSMRLQDITNPDDVFQDSPVLTALFNSEEPFATETRYIRADGSIVWLRSNLNQLYDSSGAVIGGTAISVDVTAEHLAAQNLRESNQRNLVLVAELQHRTRNLLGLVRSMARRILETSSSLAVFRARFEERLSALSRVQGLIARRDDHVVTLAELVQMELAAAGSDTASDRVRLEGPKVVLPSVSVQTMALAIHELATNAQKHGALSAPGGTLYVGWQIAAGETDVPLLCLTWQEDFTPAAGGNGPPGSGYGRELIEHALPYQLGAKTSLGFGERDVRCTIELPLEPARGSKSVEMADG